MAGAGRQASGTFEETPLPQLLAYGLERHLTGTLSMAGPRDEQALLVWSGGLVFKLWVSGGGDRLGDVLRERQLAGDATIEEAAGRGREARLPIGQVLSGQGLVRSDKLSEMLWEQVTRKLARLLTWPPATRFAFEERVDALATVPGHAVDPFPALWRALRDRPVPAYAHATLTRAAGERFRVVPTADPARFGFDADERRVVECLRARPMSVEDVAKLQVLDPDRGEILLYLLLLTRQAEPIPVIPRRNTPRARALSEPGLVPFRRALGSTVDLPREISEVRGIAAGRASDDSTDIAAVGADSAARAATIYASRGDLARAERLARRACADEPESATALALLAGILVSRADSKEADALREALGMVTRALQLDAECAAAHHQRGQIFKRFGDHAAAFRSFRRAVAADPQHVESQREIRVYEIRIRNGTLRIDRPTPAIAFEPQGEGDRDRDRKRRG